MLKTIELKEAREYHNRYRTTTETYHYFDSRFFEVGGQQWEIIATKTTGKSPHDAIHTVRKCGDAKDKFYEYTMQELINRYKKGILK